MRLSELEIVSNKRQKMLIIGFNRHKIVPLRIISIAYFVEQGVFVHLL